jgi:hypothetical protein
MQGMKRICLIGKIASNTGLGKDTLRVLPAACGEAVPCTHGFAENRWMLGS